MKRRSIKIVLYGFFALIVLIISAVFLIASNFGLVNIVAPSVGYLIGSGFYVDRASFSLSDFRLKAYGVRVGEKLRPMVIGDAEVNFNISALFNNRLNFTNIHVLKADLNFIEDEKGIWNIPWLYTPDSTGSSECIQLDFSNIRIDVLNIIYDRVRHDTGGRFMIESHFKNVTAPSFRNSEFSVLDYTGRIKVYSKDRVELDDSDISGKFGVNLDKEYGLSSIKFDTNFSNINGLITGKAFRNDGLRITAEAETDSKYVLNIKKFETVSFHGKAQESVLNITGRYKAAPELIDLNIQATGIKPYLTKFIAQLFGSYDPGNTELEFSGRFYYTPVDAQFSGELKASDFSLSSNFYKFTNKNPIGLSLSYDIGCNPSTDTISFNKLKLNVYMSAKEIIDIRLKNQFVMQWGDKSDSIQGPAPEIFLKTTGMNMGFLNNFLPPEFAFLSGTLNSDMKLSLENQSNNLHVTGIVNFDGVNALINRTKLAEFSISNKLNLNITQLKFYKINSCEMSLNNKSGNIVTITYDGVYNSSTNTGNTNISINSLNEHFTEIFSGLHEDKSWIINMLNDSFAPYSISGKTSVSYEAKKNRPLSVIINTAEFNINGKDEERTVVSLAAPLNLNIGKTNVMIKNMPETNLEFHNLDISRINNFIPETCDFKLLSGRMDSKLECVSDTELKSAVISGTITLNSPAFFFNGKERKNLEKAEVGGEFQINSALKDSVLLIKSDIPDIRLSVLNAEQKTLKVSGVANTNLTLYDNKTELNAVHFDINSEDGKLAHIEASGIIEGEKKARTAALNISSEGIDLEKTINTISFFMPEDSNTDTRREPEPMDFDGLRADIDLKLSNIRYGKLIKGDIDTKLTLNGGTLLLYPCRIAVNNSPMDAKLYLNTDVDNGYEYKADVLLSSGFDLGPVIKTFVPGEYGSVSGNVKTMKLTAAGKGFTEKNIMGNMTGSLRAETNDLSLPANIQHYRLFRAMLIPMQIMSKIQQFMPGGLLPGNIIQAALATQNVFSYSNNIYLRNGSFIVEKQPDHVILKKIYFTGSQNDFIREAMFTGTVDANGNLNLTTNSDLSGLIVPVNIYGTLDNPSPDTAKFISDFFKSNALNLCDPSNIKGLVKSTTDGVKNTVTGTVNFVGGLIFDPVQEIQSLGNMFSPSSKENK